MLNVRRLEIDFAFIIDSFFEDTFECKHESIHSTLRSLTFGRDLRSSVDSGFGGESADFFLSVDFLGFVVNIKNHLSLFLRGHTFCYHD